MFDVGARRPKKDVEESNDLYLRRNQMAALEAIGSDKLLDC